MFGYLVFLKQTLKDYLTRRIIKYLFGSNNKPEVCSKIKNIHKNMFRFSNKNYFFILLPKYIYYAFTRAHAWHSCAHTYLVYLLTRSYIFSYYSVEVKNRFPCSYQTYEPVMYLIYCFFRYSNNPDTQLQIIRRIKPELSGYSE